MTLPAAALAGPSAIAVAGAWFFPWLVAAVAYYHSVRRTLSPKDMTYCVMIVYSNKIKSNGL